MKVLFLHTELSGYFLSCLKNLATKVTEIHVIHLPVNNDAPFLLDEVNRTKFFERDTFKSSYELNKLCLDFNPDAIIVSGWSDSDYGKVCKKLRKQDKIVVLAIDNPWKGNLRQFFGSIWFRIIARQRYSHIWIPGIYQYSFARWLGFNNSVIKFGLYSCDHDFFNDTYIQFKQNKLFKYPKNIVFVGRLANEKGILELYSIFSNLTSEEKNGWKLIIVGTGPLVEKIISTESIEVKGFIQPNGLSELIAQTGCLILPSKYEPWGVVVHEFCTAGIPLLVSQYVGAHSAFVKSGYNGLVFDSKNLTHFKKSLVKILNKEDAELIKFGERSHQLSFQNTPEIWTNIIIELLTVNNYH